MALSIGMESCATTQWLKTDNMNNAANFFIIELELVLTREMLLLKIYFV